QPAALLKAGAVVRHGDALPHVNQVRVENLVGDHKADERHAVIPRDQAQLIAALHHVNAVDRDMAATAALPGRRLLCRGCAAATLSLAWGFVGLVWRAVIGDD